MGARRFTQRGIALILVLWMLTLLSVIAAGVAYSVRTETTLTTNQVALAKAQAYADGGLYRALFELRPTAVNQEDAWQADGRPLLLRLDEADIEVTAVDESALIDLNRAPDTLLRGLFLSVGVPEEEVESLVDAIQDWRDPDDLSRAQGAERDTYEAQGLDYVPSNADFLRVEELSRVLGVSRDIYQRIAGSVTVYSGQAGINSTIAPRSVLLALPNVAPEEVDAYLEQRESLRAENQPVPPFPPAAGFMANPASVYNLKVSARLPDGTQYIRHAVARQTREQSRPYIMLDWKEGIH